MQFFVIHKQDRNSEAGFNPTPELIAGMGKFIGEGASAGVFLEGNGLHPSSKRTRLTFSRGKRTILNGPYAGANELIAAVVLLRAHSKEEAIDWASRIAGVLGDVEIEVGQVKEPWDLGLCQKPEGLDTMRFLLAQKGTTNSETGVGLTPEMQAGLERLIAEMVKAGVFLSAARLKPSSKGAHFLLAGAKRTVTDGPFTEAKELIGGFSVLQVKSKQEAIEWASRFASVIREANVHEDVDLYLYEVDQGSPAGRSELLEWAMSGTKWDSQPEP